MVSAMWEMFSSKLERIMENETRNKVDKLEEDFESFITEWRKFRDNDFCHVKKAVEYMRGRQDIMFYLLGGISLFLIGLICKSIIGF